VRTFTKSVCRSVFTILTALVPVIAPAFPVSDNGDGTFRNPVMWADVPDLCVIRHGDTFYMVSTTMHMSPGIPVMRSRDLVNWEIVSYCYSQMETRDAFALKNGRSDYASGSWASNIRYDGKLKRFFVIMACQSTGKSYIYSSDNIEKGQWRCDVVEKCYDPGLLLDGDKRYVIYGQQGHHYRELFIDPSTFQVTLGPEKEWRKVMSHDGNRNWVEGAHVIKRGDYYYIPVIELRERRVQSVWRGKDINDPGSWEARKVFSGDIRDKGGKVILPSTGVAQGGFVDTPDGNWYALLFQDYGAVGRMPVLIPIKWTNEGWPVLGNDGKSVDEILPLPVKAQSPKTDIVTSDEFDNGPTRRTFAAADAGTGIVAGLPVERIRSLTQGASRARWSELVAQNEYGYNGSNLKLQWQWNHNPNNNLWSLTDRPGFLRLKSGLISRTIRDARNTLTQRTFGPACSGSTALDVTNMRDGDVAGIAAFQNQYGFVGVKMENGKKSLIMQRATRKDDAAGQIIQTAPLAANSVHLKVDCDFGRDKKDRANFFYSLDGQTWTKLGDELRMVYDWPDFMGYRLALFYYSTEHLGGCVDFDSFHVSDQISAAQ
jgi:arabinoxylan arabinofuranohydrolase